MPENIYYKKNVSTKESEECFRWFEERMDQLPQSIKIYSLYFPDLPATVRRMIHVLRGRMHKKNIFSGEYAVLEAVRQKLILQQNDIQKDI